MSREINTKRLLTIVLVMILISGLMIGCEEAEINEVEKITSEQLMSELTESLPGKVGNGEVITDIKLADDILIVYVDFSDAESEFISLEELAVTRTSGITDEILEYKDLDYSWDKVIVDFGDIGKVVCDKSMIVEEEVIGRYFDIPEDCLD